MTVGERLKQAIEAHAGISIREFHRRMGPDGRDVVGASYPTIHHYLKQRREPSLEFLRHAAEECGVRQEWLIAGAGLPTTEEEQRQAAVERRQGIIAHRILETAGVILDALGRPQDTGLNLPTRAPWSRSANDLAFRWWEIASVRATHMNQPPPEFGEAVNVVTMAIVAPLKPLGLGWDDMTDRDRDNYVLSIVGVLWISLGPLAP